MATPKKTNHAPQTGFTLIGVLVAAFIIAGVVLAVSRLVASSEHLTSLGRETFVATNLSREGLELIRSVRDTNWLTNDDRHLWLDHGICQAGDKQFSDTNRQVVIDPDIVRHNDSLNSGSGQLYINSVTHQWTHAVTVQATPYRRTITIDCSTKDNDPAFITVASRVTWNSHNADHNVEVKERLYNWLPEQLKINPTPTSAPSSTSTPSPTTP